MASKAPTEAVEPKRPIAICHAPCNVVLEFPPSDAHMLPAEAMPSRFNDLATLRCDVPSDTHLAFDTGAAASPDAATVMVLSMDVPMSRGSVTAENIIEQHMTPTEYAQQQAKDLERKAEQLRIMRAVVAKAGSDREANCRVFKHPGHAVLHTTLLKVVKPTWRQIQLSDLRCYRETGLPPQDLDAGKLREYREWARTIVDEIEADPAYQSVLANITATHREKYREKIHNSAEPLVPVAWLRDQMTLLCINDEMFLKINYTLEQRASMYSVEMQWAQAVQLFNEFCRSVLELRQHLPEA